MARELGVEALRWTCPPDWLRADSTAAIEPSRGIIGQKRAVRALEFGLKISSLGYNIFVTGLTGTGRMTAIELHLKPVAAAAPVPDDLVFVYNFDRAEQPRLLRLAAGKGAVLRDRMERLVREFAENLPGLFEGEEFKQRLETALEDLKAHQQTLIKDLEKRVHDAGFTMVQVQVGMVTRPEILPLVEQQPITLDKLQLQAEEGKFDRTRLEEIEKLHAQLFEDMQRVLHEVMTLREEMVRRAEQLRRDTVGPLLGQALTNVARAVGDPRVKPYLEAVGTDMADNIGIFAEPESDGEPLVRYAVNVVVDNRATEGAPVVIETEPTLSNLFGMVEGRVGKDLQSTSDHTRIRGGSLLRANGGFLVVNAFDALSEPGVWPALKRALRYRRAVIRPREVLFALTGQALQPEAVPLDVKVVMIGDRRLYDLLHELDEEFRKIFKVLADFDREMPAGREQVDEFLSLMAKIIGEEGLAHLDRGGMAALLDESVRLARSRRRLSARFSDVADVVREASYIARQEGRESVGAAEIRAAVLARRERFSLPEHKMTDLMLENVLVVGTSGAVVGQVNGLAVYDLGYHAFGLPGRVTARVALGREGVVSVEREASMSGPTHTKGVATIAGYLRGTFAAAAPLSMTASIAFEQSYGGIDGDSASSTEIYAILSALAGAPLRQDLAVTGSVDQHGRIQAIGGVNEKIEGFFRLCSERGLSGTQGVIIPSPNADDLQLEPDVVDAVAGGRFHVYTVETIEEGVELLTGVPAGARDERNAFPPESVFGRCAARLDAMADQLRRFRDV
jgi:lon-related putative ATP-dependent protease